MLAPPRPPAHDELDALIREARARGRRRRLLGSAVIGVAAGISLALWAVVRNGGTVTVRGHGPISVAVGHVTGTSSLLRRGIGDVGSGGGMTWALSGRGFWLTRDDGRTWHATELPDLDGGVTGSSADPIANIRDVQFVDQRRGWISNFAGPGVYLTTDGGRSWHVSVPPGCAGVCVGGAIDFLDASRGFALFAVNAGDDKLFRTEDGGRTWQLVSQPSVYGEITFVSSGTGFAFGGPQQMVIGPYQAPEFGHLYRTMDGGRSWSRYDVGESSRFVEEPSAFGQRVVLVQNGANPPGGLNLAPRTVYVSADGGRDWSGRSVPDGLGVPPSFDAASRSIWAWPSRTNLFTTHDAGRHWRRIVLRGLSRTASIRKVDFTSRRVGWAILYGVGPHGTLFHTSDGGLHWTPAGPRIRRHRKHG